MLGEQRNSSPSLGSRGCVGRSSKKGLLEGNPDRGIGVGTEKEGGMAFQEEGTTFAKV